MSKPSLLLIDDDEDQLVVLGTFLEQKGFVVETVRRAKDAVGRIRDGSFDCIVCDVMMPEMSGRDLVKTLRQEAQSTVPIIMLTAARDDLAPELLSIGANEFCLKRDTKKNLVPLIESLLKREEKN